MPVARLALVLAGVAGFVDAVGLLTLAGLFTAHMSGNTARLGADLGRGRWEDALPYVVAVVVFLVGIAAGTALGEGTGGDRGASRLRVVLLTEAALLAVLIAYAAVLVPHDRSPSRHTVLAFYVPAALAILAMGLQASALSRGGGAPTRMTVLFVLLTNLAQQVARRLLRRRDRDAARRVRLLAGVAVAYLAGATAGGLLEPRLALWCLAVPALALAGTAAVYDGER
jgi:uncharacterized membrane protein YoaK (UPF0700 family)